MLVKDDWEVGRNNFSYHAPEGKKLAKATECVELRS